MTTNDLRKELEHAAESLRFAADQCRYLAADVARNNISGPLALYVFALALPALESLWKKPDVAALFTGLKEHTFPSLTDAKLAAKARKAWTVGTETGSDGE